MDKNGKILIVDDSKFNREILSEILNQYTVIEVKNGYEALEYMKADKNIALVLLDLVMPEMDGFEVLKYMNQNHLIDEIAVMIISINKDDQSIEKAYELGISGYITRPFSSAVVLKKVNNIISHYKRQKKLTTIINKQIYEKYKNNDMMIMILSHIVESRNGESGLHVLHIKKLTKLLLNILVKKTNQYSLTLDDMISIEVASSLHDIGKIAIPEEILNKPSSLTKEEMEVMKSHVIIGAKMLNSLPFYNDEPIVKYGYQICRWHHERYDGNGYPDGLKGEEIPIAAQVVSIVDAYDALTSKRVYKEAYSHEEALKMIQKGKCGVFNPLLIECLMDIESYIQNDLKINEFYEDNEYFEERTQGYTLSAAMEAQGVAFPNLMIQMYRSGEASGDMDKTALTMSNQYSKDHRIKGKTKSAMMYPIILIVITIAVLLIVYLAVLPSFFDIFKNVELPLITKINISISKFLQDYWYFVLLIAAGLVVTFIALLRVEKVRFQVDKLKTKIPKFGKLLMTIYTSRFARTLCSLYTSGMSIVNALNIAKTTIGNVYIESQFDGAIKKLRNGESLSQAIKDIDGFDIKLTSSIFVGEESGRLESMLTTLADDFDFEAEQASERMITLIQPLMIIFLAVVICLIIISVLLPIYTLYNNVGNM